MTTDHDNENAREQAVRATLRAVEARTGGRGPVRSRGIYLLRENSRVADRQESEQMAEDAAAVAKAAERPVSVLVLGAAQRSDVKPEAAAPAPLALTNPLPSEEEDAGAQAKVQSDWISTAFHLSALPGAQTSAPEAAAEVIDLPEETPETFRSTEPDAVQEQPAKASDEQDRILTALRASVADSAQPVAPVEPELAEQPSGAHAEDPADAQQRILTALRASVANTAAPVSRVEPAAETDYAEVEVQDAETGDAQHQAVRSALLEMAVPPAETRLLAEPEVETAHPVAMPDMDVLEEVVARVVRQELAGELGERMTRNLRKMIRREIARALDDSRL